jgi:hypothetical protein
MSVLLVFWENVVELIFDKCFAAVLAENYCFRRCDTIPCGLILVVSLEDAARLIRTTPHGHLTHSVSGFRWVSVEICVFRPGLPIAGNATPFAAQLRKIRFAILRTLPTQAATRPGRWPLLLARWAFGALAKISAAEAAAKSEAVAAAARLRQPVIATLIELLDAALSCAGGCSAAVLADVISGADMSDGW